MVGCYGRFDVKGNAPCYSGLCSINFKTNLVSFSDLCVTYIHFIFVV